MSDILQELFGSIPLSKLVEGLESDIDDLLWALEAPLGEAAYLRIIAAQRPARELAQTMRSRKNEAPLNDAFRNAVYASTALFDLLTPAAKARVTGQNITDNATPAPYSDLPPMYDDHHNHARAPPPPPPPQPRAAPTPQPPPRAAPPPPRVASPPPIRRAASPMPPPRQPELDVYLPEITTAAQLNQEVGAMQRPGGKAVAILFMNPTSQTTAEFLPLFARLVPEFKEVRFMSLSVKRPGMEDIMSTLNVSLLPTVLTFCSDGFFRTTGNDIASVRKDLARAIIDMKTNAFAKQWPRAPADWGQSSALSLWRGLPSTVQDIARVAATDHIVRVHLLHTLPHIEDVDPRSYRTLKDADVMNHFCGHFFLQGETMFSCYDCGVNGQFADFCEKCWDNASHNGHTAMKRPAPSNSFMCDCGRLTQSGSMDVIGSHCSLHRDQSSTDALATLLALSLILNAR